jgi:Protein of unknown function (DUF3014)
MESKPTDARPLDATAGAGDARLFEPKESVGTRVAVVGVLVIAVAAGGYWWWRQHSAEPAAAPPAGPATIAVAPPAPAAQPASAAPAILHPIDAAGSAAAGAQALPPLDQADAAVTRALTDLLGTRQAAEMLQLDGFVRRVVATVDNLDRAHASPGLWPVAPTTAKFSVRHAGDTDVIAKDNDVRYAVFVRFVESTDTARAVALYVRLYPLFQQAYLELGYPHGYFNDRLVAVIDRLLATPEPTGPIAVHLTEVKGPITSQRPWVRYEFADPALEALPAGSKMLLRMGPEHARRLKLKLAEWRRAVATAAPKS